MRLERRILSLLVMTVDVIFVGVIKLVCSSKL